MKMCIRDRARAYREKKAKPLWAKIVKVLRSVYRAYCDLKSKFERLQADYGREVSKNSSLSERIYEVCAERDSLKGKVRDYERVRRAIGTEQADRILEAAYQQEQAEKERKRAARQKTRVGAVSYTHLDVYKRQLQEVGDEPRCLGDAPVGALSLIHI